MYKIIYTKREKQKALIRVKTEKRRKTAIKMYKGE